MAQDTGATGGPRSWLDADTAGHGRVFGARARSPVMARTVPLVVLFAVAAAGCLGSPGTAQVTSASPQHDGTQPTVSVVWGNDTLLWGASPPGPWVTSGIQTMWFDVDANVTALLIELDWDSDTQDLDLCVFLPNAPDAGQDMRNCDPAPGHSEGRAGSPDHPVRLLYTMPDLGRWGAQPIAGDAAVEQPFVLAATLFRGGPVPEGYSALAARGS